MAPQFVYKFEIKTVLVNSRGALTAEGEVERSRISAETALFIKGLPKHVLPVGVGGFLDVAISFVESPEKFYVQLRNEDRDITSVSEKLRSAYTAAGGTTDRNFTNPSNGQLCAAKWSEDGNWYRGAVVDRPDHRMVEVYFLDYGNTELVEKSQLRELRDDLKAFPPFAVQCKLHHITPGNVGGTTEQKKEKFEKLLVDRDVSVQIEGLDPTTNKFDVSMFFDAEGKSYNVTEVTLGRQPGPPPAVSRGQPPSDPGPAQQQGGGGGFGGGRQFDNNRGGNRDFGGGRGGGRFGGGSTGRLRQWRRWIRRRSGRRIPRSWRSRRWFWR